jgi:hypothetical protein
VNKSIIRLEWLRILQAPRGLVWLTLGFLPLAGLSTRAIYLDLLIFTSFWLTAFTSWQRSSQQAAEDSFLLARGAVTRRGLAATRLLLDATSIGSVVALAWGIYLWRDSERLRGIFGLESIVMGATCYSVLAVVLPRWRWSDVAATFLVVPPFIAGLFILMSADSGALPILVDFGFLPSFVGELRAPPLSVGILISILCIAGSLAFPPDFDERSSVERRDVAPALLHSTAGSPEPRSLLATLVLTEIRALFVSQRSQLFMLPMTILIIGMASAPVGHDVAREAIRGFSAFMFLALIATRLPWSLFSVDLNKPSALARRSPLEFLMTLPIGRRRLYVAHALTIATILGVVVAAGLALGAAWGDPRGEPTGSAGLAIAAVSLAWVQSTMALVSHQTLALAMAAAGWRSVVRSAPMMGFSMLGIAPFCIAGMGLASSRVQHAAMFAVDYAVPITLALCALAVAIHYAACRRFEQLELG